MNALANASTDTSMQAARDRSAYSSARKFLLERQITGLTPAILDKHLRLPETKPRPTTIPGLYERLLNSAQNANSRPNVVGGAIGGVQNLSKVLYGFDPRKVLDEYHTWEAVLDVIERDLKPRGKIRRTSRSIWPQFCRSVLSGAEFFGQFESAEDFFTWVDFFNDDDRARPALPMLIATEVDGLGFPLACDFLKELGYLDFGKPDVHIKDIFTALGLCEDRKDYTVFKAIVRIARNVGVAAYSVDKLFWLIGSGFFYDDPEVERVRGLKPDFIKSMS